MASHDLLREKQQLFGILDALLESNKGVHSGFNAAPLELNEQQQTSSLASAQSATTSSPLLKGMGKCTGNAELHMKNSSNDNNSPERNDALSIDNSPTKSPLLQSMACPSTEARLLSVITKATPSVPKSTGKRKRELPQHQHIFQDLIFFFFPNNDNCRVRRAKISKAIEHGALWLREWDSSVTHIIIDEGINLEVILKYLKFELPPAGVILVNDTWRADCLEWHRLVDPQQKRYRIRTPQSDTTTKKTKCSEPLSTKTCARLIAAAEPNKPNTSETTAPTTANVGSNESTVLDAPKIKDQALQQAIAECKALQDLPVDSDDEAFEREPWETCKTDNKHGLDWQQRFACMQGSATSENCPNAKTIEVLQQMLSYYESVHDQWRAISYRKAINTLKNQSRLIVNRQDAERLPNVGSRLAEKIEEIVWTSRLRRLEASKFESTDVALQTFLKIYGVGFAQASRWVQSGHRTIDDLLHRANLTDNQRIGIEHLEDFQTRIPRSEVAAIGRYIAEYLQEIDPNFEITIGGSYRRGEPTSGDVDLIVTKPDASISFLRTIVLDGLVPTLTQRGFLKAVLAETCRDTGSKWHGACCLPNEDNNGFGLSQPWRRLDILLVPWDEVGAARIYFTGNDIFNRSMRLLARKKGMRLNQRGLYRDVIRGPGQEKLTQGIKIEGEDEKRIFDILGVPWREPEDRNC